MGGARGKNSIGKSDPLQDVGGESPARGAREAAGRRSGDGAGDWRWLAVETGLRVQRSGGATEGLARPSVATTGQPGTGDSP